MLLLSKRPAGVLIYTMIRERAVPLFDLVIMSGSWGWLTRTG